MTKRRRLALLLPLALLQACAMPARPEPPAAGLAAQEQRAPVTILISIDGFRADYLRRGHSPTLDALADSGVSGALQPSFPSKTFPNHYALVTGLRPDRNGIVANVMVDPRRPDVTFRLGDPKQVDDPFWWDEAEPIWVTAQKAGVRTATMFWPGSTAAIHEVRPEDWQAYAQAMPSAQRVRAIIDWLRRPVQTRPQFMTLYFDEVDTAGHHHGPDSAETAAAIGSVDSAIADLRAGLAALGQPANLVIVADHGMATVSPERWIDLDTLVPRARYRLVSGGPVASIDPLPGEAQAVTQALAGEHGPMQCWPRADLPERFHYGRNPRVSAIICLARTGWEIGQGAPDVTGGGDHGYDPAAPEMAALFIAAGPAFPDAIRAATADNVDVYPLLARLIGITPLASDGDPATLASLARP